MGRSPCCDDEGLKKGPWTAEEDQKLMDYIQKNGHGSWRALPRHAGLNRCGKSCRLRWTNYLRPDIKRGKFSEEEERLIIHLHSAIGNKWSAMAARLPGRTDNEIKNYWNTHLKKKLMGMGIDPVTHRPRADLHLLANLPTLLAAANLGNPWDVSALRMQADAAQLARVQLLQTLVQAITSTAANSNPNVDLVALMGAANMLRGYQPGDLLQPNSRPFPGLLDGAVGLGQGTSQSSLSLPSHGLPQMPSTDHQLLPSQPCSLPLGGRGLVSQADHVSSPVVLGVNQMCSSSNNPTSTSTPSVASPAPEEITLDQFREMLSSSNVSPISSAVSFETWPTFADGDNDPCWNDILDQTPLETWPMTP